jgi:hypothetical protein
LEPQSELVTGLEEELLSALGLDGSNVGHATEKKTHLVLGLAQPMRLVLASLIQLRSFPMKTQHQLGLPYG